MLIVRYGGSKSIRVQGSQPEVANPMWLERILGQVVTCQTPVVLVGGEATGANFVIDALTKQRRIAWLCLSSLNSHDYIALGNQLASTVNTALGATLLIQALPYTFSIKIFKDQLSRLGELTIACSGADLSPGFAEALAKLQSDTCHIILDTSTELELSVPARFIAKAELALTQDEARHLGAFTLRRPNSTRNS